MKRSVLSLLVVTAFLVACDDSPRRAEPTATAIPRWDAPPDYDFVVRQSCGEQNFLGTFRISVREGRVDAVEPRDQSARAAVEYMDRHEMPTLPEIVGLAREAQAKGADVATVVYDAEDGHPERIDVDHRESAIDDESCYVVRDYTIGGRSSPSG